MPGQAPLTRPDVARHLVSSVVQYHQRRRWHAWLFVLMPDHCHGILSFPGDASMGRIVGEWKKYHAGILNVEWQANFFDHRLRSDAEYVEKAHYIRMNPVRAALCARPEDWPWTIEPWRELQG
jgi:putative transposase